jgi:beta-mannosidase
MMVEYRVPVKNYIQEGANVLVITFPSTFLRGKGLEKEHGKYALWNGDSSRLHVRKAQYK